MNDPLRIPSLPRDDEAEDFEDVKELSQSMQTMQSLCFLSIPLLIQVVVSFFFFFEIVSGFKCTTNMVVEAGVLQSRITYLIHWSGCCISNILQDPPACISSSSIQIEAKRCKP